ncbi:MAG: PDZ domain-containing protein [Nitriliruptoraceae bacterium]
MAAPIRYRVDLSDRLHHLVRVTMTVPGELAPGARLVLPVWTPGSYVVRDYARHVQTIVASDDRGASLALRRDGTTAWRLPDEVTGDVEIAWELYANDLSVRTNHVDDHHALLIPAATFLCLDGAEDRPHQVHLPPDPDHHRVVSLLPPGEAPDTYVATDRDHLIDSAFEVGDLPRLDLDIEGVPHTFVWSGHGGAPDLERIGRDLEAIAAASRAIFGGALPTDRYTILCAGWEDGGGGLEHRDGAVLQMPIHTFQDPELTARFQSLLAHEYLHLWNVKRLVPAALVHPTYDRPTHSESLWVAEGWTAYYDELVPTRAGLWRPRRLLDTLQATWARTRDTPGVHRQSLRQASHEAWIKHYVRDHNAPNVMTDYYGHGSLVAFELDLRLRRADPGGDGLDAVFRRLWQRHGQQPAGFDESDVVATIAEIGGDELAALAAHRVTVPGLPELDEVVGAVGLRWEDADPPGVPHLGVHLRESDSEVVLASVLRDGPAWSAGLSGEDRLLAVDGRTVARGRLDAILATHTPGQEVAVTVARGPRLLTRTVTLGAPRPQQRLVRDPDAGAAASTAFHRWCGADLDQVES